MQYKKNISCKIYKSETSGFGNKKKKILLLLPTLEWGGAEKQALLLGQYLKKKEIEIIIGAFAERGIVEKKCNENSIKCFCLPGNKNFFYYCIWVYAKIYDCILRKKKYILKDTYSLYRLVKKEKVTHIISYCAVPGTIAGTLKRFMPKVHVIWFQRDAGIYNAIEEYQEQAIKAVDLVLANSSSGRKWVWERYKREAKIIYNGIEMPEARMNKGEWLEKLGKNKETLIVTMVANLSSAKDHMTLLKAWEKVVEREENIDMVLALAGRYDDKYEELHEYVKKSNMKEKVVFLGLEDDIVGLLKASVLFVFSAISEGTSNAIAEACMSELCVVATNLQEIKNILSEENQEMLFAKGDYEECAKKIIYAIEEEEKRKKIGECNRRKAEELFDKEKNFNKVFMILDEEI